VSSESTKYEHQIASYKENISKLEVILGALKEQENSTIQFFAK